MGFAWHASGMHVYCKDTELKGASLANTLSYVSHRLR